MIRTHDHAQVGAPNCKSIISGTSRQFLKTLNTCWFYMFRTHDRAQVGAPNCKHITFDTAPTALECFEYVLVLSPMVGCHFSAVLAIVHGHRFA